MSRIAITKSSGNVFADIGLPNAKEHLVKAALVSRIADIMEADGLTQTVAATRTGIDQGDLSKVLRGHFHGYSVEKLMNALTKLGQDVTIEVRAAKRKIGKVAVELEDA
jgi:predicted XRE-type DNA-binding protein